MIKNCALRWSFTKEHNMMHGQQNVSDASYSRWYPEDGTKTFLRNAQTSPLINYMTSHPRRTLSLRAQGEV